MRASGSSASKKKANHGCLDKMHVTIGYRARSPGGRNRRQNPTVWLPSLSVSTNVYTDGFARVSGTSDVRLPGTYSGKQKCFSNATVTSGSSDAPPAIRRERPAEQQLGAARPEASTETPTQKNARASKPARGSPRDAIASAPPTLGSSREGSILSGVSFRNTIGRDFCLHPSSVVDDRNRLPSLRGAHEEPREPPRRRDDASSDTPPAARAARAARAAPRDRRLRRAACTSAFVSAAGRGRALGGGVLVAHVRARASRPRGRRSPRNAGAR